jgi:hypothetical protein
MPSHFSLSVLRVAALPLVAPSNKCSPSNEATSATRRQDGNLALVEYDSPV